MRLSSLAIGVVLSVTATPAGAQTLSSGFVAAAPASLFRTPPLSDEKLNDVYGTGFSAATNLRRSARDDFESFNRVTAQTMPVSFANWFNDVAIPLIASNLAR